jgi:hypothetical protein
MQLAVHERLRGNSYREECGEHISYAMDECSFSHRRICGCSSASDGVRYVVRVWGLDKKGQPINSLLTYATERMARCAAAQALFELGSCAHFWFVSMKDEDLLRPLAEVEDSSTTHQVAPTQRACYSTRR